MVWNVFVQPKISYVSLCFCVDYQGFIVFGILYRDSRKTAIYDLCFSIRSGWFIQPAWIMAIPNCTTSTHQRSQQQLQVGLFFGGCSGKNKWPGEQLVKMVINMLFNMYISRLQGVLFINRTVPHKATFDPWTAHPKVNTHMIGHKIGTICEEIPSTKVTIQKQNSILADRCW